MTTRGPGKPSSGPTRMCRAGLRYAARGWPVFPVSQDKTPLVKGWPQAATLDPDRIRHWWAPHRADMALGICTGPVSNIWVMDIDPRNGGNETLAWLVAKHGELPETLKASTPSGGTHYFWQFPKRIVIRTSSGKIGPGIDHRGWVGYVVAPPSIVAHGQYRWINPMVDPVPAPPWLECATTPKQRRVSEHFSLFPCEHCGLPHLYQHELR